MNIARAILGVILAAAALACVATLHHVLSRPPSPPQLIEAPQNAGSSAQQESVGQEIADLPRSIHTVPMSAQPLAAPGPAERPTPGTARASRGSDGYSRDTAVARPTRRCVRALWRPSRRLHARTSCDVEMRLSNEEAMSEQKQKKIGGAEPVTIIAIAAAIEGARHFQRLARYNLV
jgi:hypothetical protein